MTAGRFYVTTPIYYVNDVPHIGHTYTTVVADVVARYQRMMGRKVRFLTGSDEHGQKIQRAAERQGVEPRQLADRVVARYHDLWKRLAITHDDFIRTTEPRHRRGVEALFARIQERGDIYLDSYEGMYCTGCESFYPESQIVDGRCPEQGHPVEKVREESYFFRLSKYAAPLLRHYEEHPGFVRPDFRFNEVKRFVEMGLKDLSISRTAFSWGIPLPNDPRHVFYVWFDALANYITALDSAEEGPLYREFWPADLQLVGKDIVRFHAVYWPAFLLSAGLPLPETIFAHGWWLRSDQKMSKTTGNIVDPLPLLADFGPSALRYFLLREMAFGQDAQFSEEALIDRVNNDLANDLGNLLSRVLKMVEDFRGGVIPSPPPGSPRWDPSGPIGPGILPHKAGEAVKAYREAFEACRFHEGLAAIWELIGWTNRFIVAMEPWKLAKDADGEAQRRLDGVLHDASEALRVAAVAVGPIMPDAASEMWRQMGGEGSPEAAGVAGLSWGGLRAGQKVRRGAALFPRVDKSAYFSSAPAKEKTMDPKSTTPPPEGQPTAAGTITIDDFMKVKLRAGRIIEAERVAGADKLLKLLVDIGTERRTVLAGIALVYAPETLVGKSIILVANLAPRTMRGIESQGMILAADVDGRPIVATFEADVPPGSVVR